MKSKGGCGILTTSLEEIHMILYLIRHGQTDWNKGRKLQGRTDIPLNENGRAVAELTREGFKEIPFDMAFTSPLKRARETAEIILAGRNIPIIDDERVIEVNFGEYEGCDFDLPDEYIQNFFSAPEKYFSIHGTETMESIFGRMQSFLQDLYQNEELQDKTILVSTHGAALSGLLTVIKGNPVDKYWAGGLHKNCGYTVLEIKDGVPTILQEAVVAY